MKSPAHWASTALATLALSFSLGSPGHAQTARERDASVDLTARLKEVEGNPVLLEAARKTGAKVSQFCANCHGEGGNSTNPDTPNLAGQNTAYLLEQLRRFTDGRRKNEFMEGMIKALKADEKIGITVYYASRPVFVKPGGNAGLIAQGKEHYTKVCLKCHGEKGQGTDRFARIAGQQSGYLTKTLQRYRSGSKDRIEPLMWQATMTMKDSEIDAVVAYVSSMQ